MQPLVSLRIRHPVPDAGPAFCWLDRTECETILARNVVGRLAYALDERVDVQPMHFVYEDGWIYGRTARGAKVVSLQERRWVAFEVDEVDGLFDWRSVVVRGRLAFLEEGGTPEERAARVRGLSLLRRVVPGAGSPADPVPTRSLVWRIQAEEVSGRAAASGW